MGFLRLLGSHFRISTSPASRKKHCQQFLIFSFRASHQPVDAYRASKRSMRPTKQNQQCLTNETLLPISAYLRHRPFLPRLRHLLQLVFRGEAHTQPFLPNLTTPHPTRPRSAYHQSANCHIRFPSTKGQHTPNPLLPHLTITPRPLRHPHLLPLRSRPQRPRNQLRPCHVSPAIRFMRRQLDLKEAYPSLAPLPRRHRVS